MVGRSVIVVALCLTVLISCSAPEKKVSVLAGKIARFAPTEITADISSLTPGDRSALD